MFNVKFIQIPLGATSPVVGLVLVRSKEQYGTKLFLAPLISSPLISSHLIPSLLFLSSLVSFRLYSLFSFFSRLSSRLSSLLFSSLVYFLVSSLISSLFISLHLSSSLFISPHLSSFFSALVIQQDASLTLDIVGHCLSSLVMVGRLDWESHIASAPAEALQTDAGCHRAMALVKAWEKLALDIDKWLIDMDLSDVDGCCHGNRSGQKDFGNSRQVMSTFHIRQRHSPNIFRCNMRTHDRWLCASWDQGLTCGVWTLRFSKPRAC